MAFEDFEDETPEYMREEEEEYDPAENEDPEATHFAATLDLERLGAEIMARIDDYYAFVERSNRSKVWKDAYYAFYGFSRDGFHTAADIDYAGEEGELVDFKINHFRSIATHVVTATTKDRPKWDPIAKSNTPQDILAVQITEDVLESYMRRYNLGRQAWRACNTTVIGGEAFISRLWDPDAGMPTVDEESGEETTAGDFMFRVYHPVDVPRDWRKGWDRTEWVALRDFENRYDLAASYPAMAEQVLESEPSKDASWWSIIQQGDVVDSDDIPIYYFMHKPTPAVPEGRYVVLLDHETILYEGPLPYGSLPLSRQCPLEHEGSCFGYSPFWDLLAPQRILDMMVSAGATNYDAFGVQVVAAMKGTEVTVDDLGKGLSLLYYPPGASPPQGVNLTQMPEGYMNYMNFLLQSMRDVSGVNAAVIGDPRQALGSGAPAEAMALLMNQFMSYNSDFLRSYAELLEDLGTGIVETLKLHAEYLPRRVLSLTRNKELVDNMMMVSGGSLDPIGEVYVDMGNAMSRTDAGRKVLVDMLVEYARHLGQPVFDGPHALYEVFQTGRLDSAVDKLDRELRLVKMENAMMMRGERPRMFALDDHQTHIEEHKAVLASPQARTDENLFGVVAQHIMEHQQAIAAASPGGGPEGPAGPEGPGGPGGPPKPPEAPPEAPPEGGEPPPQAP